MIFVPMTDRQKLLTDNKNRVKAGMIDAFKQAASNIGTRYYVSIREDGIVDVRDSVNDLAMYPVISYLVEDIGCDTEQYVNDMVNNIDIFFMCAVMADSGDEQEIFGGKDEENDVSNDQKEDDRMQAEDE